MTTAPISGQENFGTGRPIARSYSKTTIALTSAQILLLLGTPVQVVPAPGVGKMIIPLWARIDFSGGSVAYTNAGGAVGFNLGSRTVQAVAEGMITTVSPNKTHQFTPFAAGVDTAANPPTDENAALTISKITNNYAAGNGTALVTVYYVVEDTVPTVG